jgi:hypothetical protein
LRTEAIIRPSFTSGVNYPTLRIEFLFSVQGQIALYLILSIVPLHNEFLSRYSGEEQFKESRLRHFENLVENIDTGIVTVRQVVFIHREQKWVNASRDRADSIDRQRPNNEPQSHLETSSRSASPEL